jgi:N,N'-diacetyllegionaminate synthase
MNIINDIIKKDKCFIIAEAGVNHNGNIEIAKKMIDIACDAGVDAVKFQTFKADNLVTKNAPKADYQKETTGNSNQYEMLKKLELSLEEHLELKVYCENKGVMFISTPFDFQSADMLENINISLYKISSGDLTNLPFLNHIAKFNKPIILSTGMANLGEVEEAIETIKSTGNDKIVLLHCTSNYPTEYKDVNLKAMSTLANAFKLPVGYSDHTLGTDITISAVAMGAIVIEKHFTLDKDMEGPDHRVSLNPIELTQMVKAIKHIKTALGDGIKKCTYKEEKSKLVSRKSLVAKVNIKKDEIITLDMVDIKRPGNGIEPKFIELIIGKIAVEDIQKDSLFNWNKIR